MQTKKGAVVSWIVGTAGLFGFLLGLRYKAAGLIAASGVACVAVSVVALQQGWSLSNTAVVVTVSLLAMQGAYLLGLITSGWGSGRRGAPHE